MCNPYCLTYFLVKHGENNFDIEHFAKCLGLDVELLKHFGTSTTIEIGRNEYYDADINVMVRVSIKDLIGKEDILKRLKNQYNLEYFIERVPIISGDENSPRQKLSIDDDIIEFMYKSGTQDDLDYFVSDD